MNKKINQTAGQVAHKSYPSCVIGATDIAIEAYNNSHKLYNSRMDLRHYTFVSYFMLGRLETFAL